MPLPTTQYSASWELRIWSICAFIVVHFEWDCIRLSVLHGQSSVSGLCCGWTANAGWRRPNAARIIDPSVVTTGGDSCNTSWLQSCKSPGTSPAHKHSPSQCSSQSSGLRSLALPQDSTRYTALLTWLSALKYVIHRRCAVQFFFGSCQLLRHSAISKTVAEFTRTLQQPLSSARSL
jgi:hypothetical protein